MPNSYFRDLASNIRGPVYPICPAFKRDGALDLGKTASYVRYLVKGGAKNLITTAGTSRFNLLSEDEVRELNATVCDASGDALTIVGNPVSGGTDSAISVARHAQEIGANALLVFYPERFYSNEDVFDYFSDISEAAPQIGIMAHAWPMRAAKPTSGATVPFSVSLVRMMSDLPNFIGMKEEHGDDNLRYELVTAFAEDLAFIVAGSAMAMYLSAAPYGVRTYLTSIGSFYPPIEEDFYSAHSEGRFNDALALVRKYEDPFFAVAKPMGWHLAMKATLDLMGLMPRYERLPLKPLSESDSAAISRVIKSFGWL